MTNLIHLFTVAFLALNFSGVSLPKEPKKEPVPSDSAVSKKREGKEFIPWMQDHRLDWDDFQCTPKKNGDAVASTSTSLGIAYQLKNGELTYQLTCAFSKTKSWGLVKTDYILAHEQGHFDITEIYTRKLYQALLAYEFNRKTYQRDINRIYQKIVTEKETLQNMYDKQSDHSRNKKTQLAWLEIIDALLTETAPYAEYP